LADQASLDDLKRAISPTPEVIEDARNGKMVILVDEEDRENEGDLVIPAQFATPAAVNFMAKHGRGLICLALKPRKVSRPASPRMIARTRSRWPSIPARAPTISALRDTCFR
jgi:3,4-dihydroxy 2-butanone 4-phosphate synthase/GTP cyclohydrolase II